MPSPDAMPAYVGNPLAGDPIWEASSASELRIAITTKQVSRAGHPSDLLVANLASRDVARLAVERERPRIRALRGSCRRRTGLHVQEQGAATAVPCR